MKWIKAIEIERVGKDDVPIKTDFGFDVAWYDAERKEWFTSHDGTYKNDQVEYLDESENDLLRTISPFQIEELTTYFLYSKVNSIIREDKSGNLVITFISHLGTKKDMRSSVILYTPEIKINQ